MGAFFFISMSMTEYAFDIDWIIYYLLEEEGEIKYLNATAYFSAAQFIKPPEYPFIYTVFDDVDFFSFIYEVGYSLSSILSRPDYLLFFWNYWIFVIMSSYM